jgi:2-succinyl-6-hydroxy-2,4-cyclohexadiene-1-carboxylate synthase
VASTAVLLHGFAGTARHWDRVIAASAPAGVEPLAVELAEADPLTPDGVAMLVSARAPARFVLAGYSMGGRAALYAALGLGLAGRVERLVLLSAGAGIEDPAERAQRRAEDEALAASIEREGIEWFVARWRDVPLFAGDPPWVADAVAHEERACDPAVLAASLRGLGPGSMAPMWDRLGELALPVAVLAGARDARYVAQGRRLASAIPRATFEVVAGAGHRLALEAPHAVARALHAEAG